jgi:uncharacterized protein
MFRSRKLLDFAGDQGNESVESMALQVDEAILDRIVDHIVEAVQPERIIMFGSAARGELGRDSDIDLLVIKRHVHRGRTTDLIYRRMRGVGFPVDIIVAHPEDIEQYRDSPALIFRNALRDGRVIYDSHEIRS